MGRTLFLMHVASTLFMVGVIWFVQIVHYPLFKHVGVDEFPTFARKYANRTTLIVMPPMLIELATGLALFAFRPAEIPISMLWIGLGFMVMIWLSTFFLQVPKHGDLSHGFDIYTISDLITSNWLRTLAWSVRGALVLFMLALAFGD